MVVALTGQRVGDNDSEIFSDIELCKTFRYCSSYGHHSLFLTEALFCFSLFLFLFLKNTESPKSWVLTTLRDGEISHLIHQLL